MSNVPPSYRQRIAALLHQIPDDERAVFERYYQEQLHVAVRDANDGARSTPAGAADPDQVEATLIRTLMRNAEGRDHVDGLGEVPTADYVFELVPPETDPRLGAVRGGRSFAGYSRGAGTGADAPSMTTGRWMGLALVGIVGTVLLLRLLIGGQVAATTGEQLVIGPTSPPPSAAVDATTASLVTPTPFASVNIGDAGAQEAVDPTSLEFDRLHGAPVVFPIAPSSGQRGGIWEPMLEPGSAGWLQGTYVNTVICLGQDALPLVHMLGRGEQVLVRAANGAVRHYEIVRVRQVGRQQTEVLDQRRAGLTIVVCGTAGNDRTIVEAVERPEQLAAPRQSAGDAVDLADLVRVQVAAVRVITPTARLAPGLAETVIEASVSNLTDMPLRWEDLLDQLEIDGRMADVLPLGERAPLGANESRTVEYRYLAPTAGGPAIWHLTAPTGESVALSLKVPPAPPGSAGRFHAVLRPDDVRIRRATDGGPPQLLLALAVSNRSEVPVVVRAHVVSVWDRTTALPLRPHTTPFPLFVEGGTSQTVTLVTDYPDGNIIMVQFGDQRWRIALP